MASASSATVLKVGSASEVGAQARRLKEDQHWEEYKQKQQAKQRAQKAKALEQVVNDRDMIRATRLDRFLPMQTAAAAGHQAATNPRDKARKSTAERSGALLTYSFNGPQPGTPAFLEQQRKKQRELEVRRRAEGFEATERVREVWAGAPSGEHTLTRWLQSHRLEMYRDRLLAAGVDDLLVIMQLDAQELIELQGRVGMAPGHRATFQMALRATKPRVLLTEQDTAALTQHEVDSARHSDDQREQQL